MYPLYYKCAHNACMLCVLVGTNEYMLILHVSLVQMKECMRSITKGMASIFMAIIVLTICKGMLLSRRTIREAQIASCLHQLCTLEGFCHS